MKITSMGIIAVIFVIIDTNSGERITLIRSTIIG